LAGLRFGIVVAQQRGDGAEHIHRRRLLGHRRHRVADGFREFHRREDARAKLGEFALSGEFAVEQEVRHFIEGGVLREIADGISAIAKARLCYFTDGCLSRHNACQTAAAHRFVSQFAVIRMIANNLSTE
jgi:hypothetical protein